MAKSIDAGRGCEKVIFLENYMQCYGSPIPSFIAFATSLVFGLFSVDG
jgi:hypothetical protein